MVVSPGAKTLKSKKTHKPNIAAKEGSKINIIFDLDATLINSVFHETVYGNEDPQQNINSIGPLKYGVIPGKKTNSGHEDNIMYYRPFTTELLAYLTKHPRVKLSVWSTGEQKYVENICKVLFGADWAKKLVVIISRKSRVPKYTSIITQTGEVFDSDFENNAIKDLDVLYKHQRWGRIFTPKNTLLIDDNFAHYVKNFGRNIIHVPGWDGVNSCDTVLFELQQWLEKAFAKSKCDMSKIAEFIPTNRQGMTSGPAGNLYRDDPSIIRTITKNNMICAPKLYKYHSCLKQVGRKPNLSPSAYTELKAKCAMDNLFPSTNHKISRKSGKSKNSKQTTRKPTKHNRPSRTTKSKSKSKSK